MGRRYGPAVHHLALGIKNTFVDLQVRQPCALDGALFQTAYRRPTSSDKRTVNGALEHSATAIQLTFWAQYFWHDLAVLLATVIIFQYGSQT